MFSYSSHWWPAAEGLVLRSQLREGTAYADPVVEYEYYVDGETNRSTRITLVQVTKKSNIDTAKDLIARLPQGKKIQVRVLPGWPSFAVVEPGVDSASIGMLLAGAVLLLVFHFRGRGAKREEVQIGPSR
jgi:hypothetical protein